MTPIPVPMRRRILQLYERGKGTREIAQFFGFCVAAVRRVRQQFRQRGTLQPRTRFSLNSEVEVGFMEICWPILGSGCGFRMQLRRSWDAVS